MRFKMVCSHHYSAGGRYGAYLPVPGNIPGGGIPAGGNRSGDFLSLCPVYRHPAGPGGRDFHCR